MISRVSLFSLERTLRMMSSLIFLVAAMLSMICRLVISFFSMFLLVLSFSVCTTLASSRTCAAAYVYYQFSFPFRMAISPFFLRIYRTLRAFCSSIYIMALRSWMRSLKF